MIDDRYCGLLYINCNSMNFLEKFPDSKMLPEWYERSGNKNIYNVNGHIHSPYSFSAFDDLEQAFRMAVDEGVKVLGINDFNTTEGYHEFYQLSSKYNVFPLFNIEFMGLMKDKQREGIRINDPNNPGRIYFSGKGLDYPVSIGKESEKQISGIINESHQQVKAMIIKLNENLKEISPGMELDFDEIRKRYTRGMVRERHLARALRLMVFENIESATERIAFFKKLYGGKEPVAEMDNIAAVENEIRSRLLKAGGLAFVEEDPEAFLELEQIISIITDAGGIPCYPVLLDDANGRFTEFEGDMESLYQNLKSYNVSCIELIPGRNDHIILKRFVSWFREKGFTVLFGTEHNSPSLDPLTVSARGGVDLDEELRLVSYEGACDIAAHQYLRAKGEEGYVFSSKEPMEKEKIGFTQLGAAVIEKFMNI